RRIAAQGNRARARLTALARLPYRLRRSNMRRRRSRYARIRLHTRASNFVRLWARMAVTLTEAARGSQRNSKETKHERNERDWGFELDRRRRGRSGSCMGIRGRAVAAAVLW